MPNVDTVNIGWDVLGSLYVKSNTKTVVLGASDAESVGIETIVVRDGASNIEKNENLQNISVGSVELSYNREIIELALPFDQLSGLRIFSCPNLTDNNPAC